MSEPVAPEGNRRLVRVNLSLEVLDELLRQGHRSGGPDHVIETIDGIPLTASFIGSFQSDDRLSLFLVYADDSFEPVPYGAQIPTRRIVFRRSVYPPEILPNG